MENNGKNINKRKGIVVAVALSSVAIVLFLCIFSLYHLPTRHPIETPDIAENPNYVESPIGDFQETNDVMSASQEQASAMLGELEMQYENAKVNNEPYAAQQAGMRLALGYWKAGQKQQAIDFLKTLINNFSYDSSFVEKCQELISSISSNDGANVSVGTQTN